MLMPDPMVVLRSFQQAIKTGAPVDPKDLDESYLTIYDEPNNRKRFSFVKIVAGEAQVLAIFGIEEPVHGLPCWNVGYAVSEAHRGKNLAVEAVSKGIKELKRIFAKLGISKFYVEAVIDEKNLPSLKVAARLFEQSGSSIRESSTATPAMHFIKLIES